MRFVESASDPTRKKGGVRGSQLGLTAGDEEKGPAKTSYPPSALIKTHLT